MLRSIAGLLLSLGIACLWGDVLAQLVDEELQQQLEVWAEQPLDLRRASAEELAQLPWLDWRLARSIVTLREEGALHRWDDLDLVPELDEATKEALRPFVTLDEGNAFHALPQRVWWRVEGEERGEASVRRREHLEVRAPRWKLRAQRGERGVWAGAQFDLPSSRVLAGRLRLDPGTPLLGGDPLRRSRFGAVSGRNPLRARLRTDTQAVAGFEGAALQSNEGRWLLAAGRDGDRGENVVLAWNRKAPGASGGLALDLRRGASEGALWWEWNGAAASRLEVAGGPGAWRAAARCDWTGEGWSAQGALVSSLGNAARGSDPASGHALDRPHRSGQLQVRHRLSRATIRWTARVVERGVGEDRDLTRRLRLEGTWRGPREATASAEILQGGLYGPGEGRLRLALSQRLPQGRRRLGVAWRGDEVASGALAWAQLDRGLLRVALAAAGGQRSSPWAVAYPQGTLRLLWLRPGDFVVAAGRGLRLADQRWGLWAGIQTREDARSQLWLGLRWEGALGPRPGAKVAASASSGPWPGEHPSSRRASTKRVPTP